MGFVFWHSYKARILAVSLAGVVILALHLFSSPSSESDQSQSAGSTVSKWPSFLSQSDSRIPSKLMWISFISTHESTVYSQNGEDGILDYIFDNLGTTNKRYVEFGTQDCSECNTRHLWENRGWDGLLIDGDGVAQDGRIIRNHMITAENIVHLFQMYNVSKTVDLQSIDIDRNDYYVQKQIFEAGYRPRVFVSEYNRNFGPQESITIRYQANSVWDHTAYFGVSALAWKRLANKYGYSLIYIDLNGVNMFFVHRSVLVQHLAGYGIHVAESAIPDYLPTYEALYRRQPPLHVDSLKSFYEGLSTREWVTVLENGDAVPHQFE